MGRPATGHASPTYAGETGGAANGPVESWTPCRLRSWVSPKTISEAAAAGPSARSWECAWAAGASSPFACGLIGSRGACNQGGEAPSLEGTPTDELPPPRGLLSPSWAFSGTRPRARKGAGAEHPAPTNAAQSRPTPVSTTQGRTTSSG